ncbi:DUF1403 family protein [Methylocystis sp. H4A]|nr:DUF1403 family protein [Methylocystis sp. H4A]
MLLDDDCVSPARAAKRAKLSDRSARRLFDRLIELNVVRELTGRDNFRLYGLLPSQATQESDRIKQTRQHAM